ncbi:hypothetical protein [Paenibacillus sp. UNC451MF]|uniref:hypothetical protein n=1 Tax=Paenibacillus sp. UNC451MF TaxID=1449063 RepID=UPI00048D38D6|nr:hypothetical protein [Paenibacillus sp. UNC451MF]
MRVLFCSDPLNDKRVDPDYEMEYKAAVELGIEVELFSLESLLEGNLSKALKRISNAETKETIVYCGWMMKPEVYKK